MKKANTNCTKYLKKTNFVSIGKAIFL